MRGHTDILQLHSGVIVLAGDVELDTIAGGTPVFSGAKLVNLVSLEAMRATISWFADASLLHFKHTENNILIGAERRSVLLSEETQRTMAYREGGHALFCLLEDNAVHKTTIRSRRQPLA